MLADPMFFIQVPTFLYLQPSMTVAAAAAAAHPTACDSCGDLWKYYRPVADAFVIKLQELIEEQSVVLENIRAYLSQKKRYDIRQVVVYYRASGKGKILKLTL